MSVFQVAIVIHENAQAIQDLAQEMHVWVVATERNKAVLEALWQLDRPEQLSLSHFDVPVGSSVEDICGIALDLVEAHHSAVFSAMPWLELQVHGSELTQKLHEELNTFGNIIIQHQDYGFSVTRTDE